MTGRRALWALIVLLFAGFALAGPTIMVRDAVRADGGGNETADEPLVVMVDLQFSPTELRVPAGTTVVWSNQDVAPHTVTSDAADSGLIDPGGSFSMTVEERFSYACTLHPSMTGSIEVT